MSAPDALDILKVARAKIAKPEDWGKGRRGHDRPIETCCAAEAIEEADPIPLAMDERKRAFRAFANATAIANFDDPLNFPRAMVDWNDAPEREHIDVIRGFDLAIATLSLGAPIRVPGAGP